MGLERLLVFHSAWCEKVMDVAALTDLSSGLHEQNSGELEAFVRLSWRRR